MRYCDFHADTLTEITEGNLYQNNIDIDLYRVEKLCEQYIQVFAIWKDVALVKNIETDFWKTYQQSLEYLKNVEQKVSLCLSAEDMERALIEGKAAAFLSIEDCSYMGRYIEQIRELGFRFAMLTWNYENQYGYGATVAQWKGLKTEGKELARKLVEKNIILDVSHLSDAGIEDIFSITDRPVIASHSNVRSVCEHPRNLCSEHMQEIIRRKGIIGINLYRPFVGRRDPVTLTNLFRHIDNVLNHGGIDSLVFGCDFDGCDGLFPEEIYGVESMQYLKDQMCKAGFSEVVIEKAFFQNGYRFIKENVV